MPATYRIHEHKGFTVTVYSDRPSAVVYDSYGEECGSIERLASGLWAAYAGNFLYMDTCLTDKAVMPSQALRSVAIYHGSL